MSSSIDIHLYGLRGELMALSNDKIDFLFERNNSNPCVGTYRITLKCSEEIEEYINEHWSD